MTKLFLGLFFTATALAHAQTPTPFTVKGRIGQLNAPAKIYVLRGDQVLDSATFQNGSFQLKGSTDGPQVANLIIKRDGKLGSNGMARYGDTNIIILEPGPIVVLSPDSLKKATVTGSPLTADNQKLQASLKPFMEKMQAVGAASQKASEEEQKSEAFKLRRQAQFAAINKEVFQQTRAFIKEHPASWVSLHELVGMSMWEPPTYAVEGPLFAALSPALRNSPLGRPYGERLQTLKDVGIGLPAPAISQKTPAGKVVTLADYRGKYVLVDFWASWCGPCRAENPALTKVYNEYKSRNFDILSVSLDDEKGRAKWLKAVQDDNLAWTQVSELRGFEGDAAKRYHVKSIPQNYLIDPTGKIVAVNLRGNDLPATLARLLN